MRREEGRGGEGRGETLEPHNVGNRLMPLGSQPLVIVPNVPDHPRRAGVLSSYHQLRGTFV